MAVITVFLYHSRIFSIHFPPLFLHQLLVVCQMVVTHTRYLQRLQKPHMMRTGKFLIRKLFWVFQTPTIIALSYLSSLSFNLFSTLHLWKDTGFMIRGSSTWSHIQGDIAARSIHTPTCNMKLNTTRWQQEHDCRSAYEFSVMTCDTMFTPTLYFSLSGFTHVLPARIYRDTRQYFLLSVS